jgi:iron complex transport system substrate-binding protein
MTSIQSKLRKYIGLTSRRSWACRAAGLVCIVFASFGLGRIASPAAAPPGAVPQAGTSTREVTDELGRKIQAPQDVKRVVSLAPNLTEIVFALGKGIRLVGDTDFCDYPLEAEQKPHVGGPTNPNFETIAALKPDLVLASGSINFPSTVEALDRLGVPVFVTYPHSVEGMIASVEHIGVALGAEKSAAELAQDLRDRIADLKKRVGNKAPRRVLFVVWTDPLISIGNDTFIADALRIAGGESVVQTKGEWPHVSLEEIVHLQPEVLIFASAHGAETHREIDDLLSRPGWRDLRAMREDKVVVLSDAINRPAPRMVDAIERLAVALHPEAFRSGAAAKPSRDTDARGLNREVRACAL